MDFSQFSNLYREIIIEHSQSPQNQYVMANPTYQCELLNPTCGDAIVVYIKVKDEVIEEVSFMGQGCAISMASASMMTQVIKSLSFEEARSYIENFNQLIKGESIASKGMDELGDAALLEGVKNFPARYKCAALAWLALEKTIKD